jgi:RNA polymerase sigma factor (TIGR02999 family)
MDTAPENLTALLTAFAQGDRGAAEELLPVVYEELRRIAHRRRWQWRGKDAPNTTSLVHEVFLHLSAGHSEPWASRAHFFYFASVAMRNVLVDHARHLQRAKRGGGLQRVELREQTRISEQKSVELLALDEALSELGAREPRLLQIVECRFFGGLTVEETAEALDISTATVKRGWDTARAWLYQHLHGGRSDESHPVG